MEGQVVFRFGTRDDVAAVVAMLADDVLGRDRERSDLDLYQRAFDQMLDEGANHLIVGEQNGLVVACYQITFISGLSLGGMRRAQIEGVRVATEMRGHKLGEALIADAEARARQAGCSILQFTTNKSRQDAHRFYDRLGFTPSHIGYKKAL